MKNKLLIGLIIFLVVGIIAVAGALVYVNKNNSNSNTTNIQSSTSINEPGESVQNTEVQSQSVISEPKIMLLQKILYQIILQITIKKY